MLQVAWWPIKLGGPGPRAGMLAVADRRYWVRVVALHGCTVNARTQSNTLYCTFFFNQFALVHIHNIHWMFYNISGRKVTRSRCSKHHSSFACWGAISVFVDRLKTGPNRATYSAYAPSRSLGKITLSRFLRSNRTKLPINTCLERTAELNIDWLGYDPDNEKYFLSHYKHIRKTRFLMVSLGPTVHMECKILANE